LARRCRLSYIASESLPGGIGAAAALEEQGVARHQSTVDQEALAARRVTGRVDQVDADVAHGHDVARLVHGQVAVGQLGHLIT
jgi:hypothetical protein